MAAIGATASSRAMGTHGRKTTRATGRTIWENRPLGRCHSSGGTWTRSVDARTLSMRDLLRTARRLGGAAPPDADTRPTKHVDDRPQVHGAAPPRPSPTTLLLPMHVAIDFSESEHQPTGVGTFTGGVVDAWCDRVAAGSLRLSLLTREEVALPEAWRLAGVRCRASGRAAHPILWQRTRLPGLVREAAPDVFLGPAYALPPRLRVPAAVALHDLSFERFPRAWSWRESWRRRLLARDAARRARRIVTISHFSAAEVEALYGVPREKIVVVPLGVRPGLAHPAAAAGTGADGPDDHDATPRLVALRRELGLRDDLPTVLHVGTLLARRNLPTLIAAAARVPGGAQLVVVGAHAGSSPLNLDALALEAGLAGPLVHLPWIEAARLADLYRLADVYVSLSEYEGFGLPVLEAIASGTPAVVLGVGASQELWSGHALTVSRLEPESVAAAIAAVLEDPACGLQGRDALLERYTWKACGEAVLKALRECLA
ncbi:MAG: glycosyltransferase family 1 protein [Acidobacteria bacterium]|nr:MAG: glycosyltransferase family 1 protein [Acidobacteriota bacterium]